MLDNDNVKHNNLLVITLSLCVCVTILKINIRINDAVENRCNFSHYITMTTRKLYSLLGGGGRWIKISKIYEVDVQNK